MLADPVLEKLTVLLEGIATSEGCRLYDIEFGGHGGNRTLRVFIDKDPGPVDIEDCSKVSKALNEILDSQDLIPGGNYYLEVSSPGVDRRLTKDWHYQTAAGKRIWMQISQNLQSLGIEVQGLQLAKKLDGICQGLTDGRAVKLELGKEIINIPLDVIEKAHVVFEMESSGKKKQKR